MRGIAEVKIFQSFMHDPSPDNCRPPWWVMAIAIIFVMYIFMG